MTIPKTTLATIAALVIALPLSVDAYQADAPFLMEQKMNKKRWADEDFQIAKKLAKLRNKLESVQTSSTSWPMMSVGGRWAGKAVVNTGVPPPLN